MSADGEAPHSEATRRVEGGRIAGDSWDAWLSSSSGAPSEAELALLRSSDESGARALIASLRDGSRDRAQVRRCFLALFLAGATPARVAREFALESAGRNGDTMWPLWREVLAEQAKESGSWETRSLAIRELTWEVRVRPWMYGLIKGDLRLPFSGVGQLTEADLGAFLAVIEPWLRDHDPVLRAACGSAVKRLAGTRTDAWMLFRGLLEDPDDAVRGGAADLLWFFIADDADVRRDVEELGRSDDWRVALTCARVLGRGGDEVPEAVRRRVTEEISRSSAPSDALLMALAVANELDELWPDEVSAVAALCSSTHAVLRGKAVSALGNAPSDSVPARTALVRVLTDSSASDSDRVSAIWALSRVGPASKEALSVLVRATASSEAGVASHARRALAERGSLDDEDVASCIGNILKTTELGELTTVVDLLRVRKQLPPSLARCVRDVIGRGNAAEHELMIPLLAGAGLASLDDLRQLVRASPSATDAAVDTALSLIEQVPITDLLAAVGPDGRCALLVRVLESSRIPVRGREALPDLLQDDDAQVRRVAAELCGKWAVRDDGTLSVLRRTAGDPHGVVRSAAAYGLWKCGERSPSLLFEMSRSLGDRDARRLSIRWLRDVGPAAAATAPSLAEIVEVDDALDTRIAACDAIAAMHVHEAEVAAALLRTLRRGCTAPRAPAGIEEGVARALAGMGPFARGAIADLLRIAEGRMQSILSEAATIQARCEALRALGEIGGLEETQVAAVRGLSKSSQLREVRRVAAEVLARFD